jgi:NAD(P)-dependent dehydrogenase (short-subunit alcohol dehydrogenase family)
MGERAEMDELRFDGKSVIVTGGGRGFGSCHAKMFAARGARVVVADYGVNLDGTGSSPEPAEAIAKEINDAGGEAIPVFANVADEADAERIVQTAIDNFGGLDILVNNAGIADPDWFEDETLERYRRMTEYQYFGTVTVAKKAWSAILESKGCVVNTASEAMLGNVPKALAYCGSKGAVFAFTRVLALDGMRHGIRVNAVAPRGNTRMSAPEVLAIHFDQPVENFDNEFMRAMKPEHVSAAVGFLAHPSCTLTGETIVCGGGQAQRLFVSESVGISTGGDIFPEDLAANVDQLLDTAGATLMGIDMFNNG